MLFHALILDSYDSRAFLARAKGWGSGSKVGATPPIVNIRIGNAAYIKYVRDVIGHLPIQWAHIGVCSGQTV